LITTSVDLLTKRGHREAYLSQLPTIHKDTVLTAPVGIWLPASVVEAHYGACDRLGLTDVEVLELGAGSAEATGRLFLSVALRLARSTGMTPWGPLESADRYWERYYRGSGIAVYKLGPKEAEFDVAGSPLARYAYWRTGFRGILSTFVAHFAQSGRVIERPARNDLGGASYRLSWV
jgi:hypothetical protein